VRKGGDGSVGVPDFGYGRNPLDSLSAAERVICGALGRSWTHTCDMQRKPDART